MPFFLVTPTHFVKNFYVVLVVDIRFAVHLHKWEVSMKIGPKPKVYYQKKEYWKEYRVTRFESPYSMEIII